MVYEIMDHGNDVICHAVPVVLFLVFRKKKTITVKNKSTTFSMVYTPIDHRNDTIKCSKLCSEKKKTMENCGRFVKQSGIIFFSEFGFYLFPISIDNNRRIKSIDSRCRFFF